eukprot:jgi/Tetstr1/444236/TSEL_032129.t1
MGVGEDPVGEDGMDIDAPAWPPADVEAADEGVIRKGDPGDFYMKVIAKKFRGVVEVMAAAQEHPPLDADGDARLVPVVLGYVSMVNLFPLAPFHLFFFGLGRDPWRKFVTVQGHIGFRAMKHEDRRQALVLIPSNFGRGLRPSFAVSKKSDGSGKVTVQSGWVMEDCLHHMETFSILTAGPLFEEARVKAIMTEKELASPAVVRSVSQLAVLGHMYKRLQGAAWFVTRWGLQNVVTEEDGPERKAQRGAKARRPGQRGANARRPGQRGANARRPGQRGANARRPGQRGAKARRPGQRGANASGMPIWAGQRLLPSEA